MSVLRQTLQCVASAAGACLVAAFAASSNVQALKFQTALSLSLGLKLKNKMNFNDSKGEEQELENLTYDELVNMELKWKKLRKKFKAMKNLKLAREQTLQHFQNSMVYSFGGVENKIQQEFLMHGANDNPFGLGLRFQQMQNPVQIQNRQQFRQEHAAQKMIGKYEKSADYQRYCVLNSQRTKRHSLIRKFRAQNGKSNKCIRKMKHRNLNKQKHAFHGLSKNRHQKQYQRQKPNGQKIKISNLPPLDQSPKSPTMNQDEAIQISETRNSNSANVQEMDIQQFLGLKRHRKKKNIQIQKGFKFMRKSQPQGQGPESQYVFGGNQIQNPISRQPQQDDGSFNSLNFPQQNQSFDSIKFDQVDHDEDQGQDNNILLGHGAHQNQYKQEIKFNCKQPLSLRKTTNIRQLKIPDIDRKNRDCSNVENQSIQIKIKPVKLLSLGKPQQSIRQNGMSQKQHRLLNLDGDEDGEEFQMSSDKDMYFKSPKTTEDKEALTKFNETAQALNQSRQNINQRLGNVQLAMDDAQNDDAKDHVNEQESLPDFFGLTPEDTLTREQRIGQFKGFEFKREPKKMDQKQQVFQFQRKPDNQQHQRYLEDNSNNFANLNVNEQQQLGQNMDEGEFQMSEPEDDEFAMSGDGFDYNKAPTEEAKLQIQKLNYLGNQLQMRQQQANQSLVNQQQQAEEEKEEDQTDADRFQQ